MVQQTIAVRSVAGFVLAHEADLSPAPRDRAAAAERALAKFRCVLVRVVGLDGFLVVLARAQELARSGIPMAEVQVSAGGSLEGQRAATVARASDPAREEDVHLLAHLLGLLVALIGEALTLGLLCQAWPDLVLDDAAFDRAAAAGRAARRRASRGSAGAEVGGPRPRTRLRRAVPRSVGRSAGHAGLASRDAACDAI